LKAEERAGVAFGDGGSFGAGEVGRGERGGLRGHVLERVVGGEHDAVGAELVEAEAQRAGGVVHAAGGDPDVVVDVLAREALERRRAVRLGLQVVGVEPRQ
jgi:hypothetical protein